MLNPVLLSLLLAFNLLLIAGFKSEFFIAFPKSSFSNEALRIFITTHHSSTTIILITTLRGYGAITYVQPGVTREVNPPSSFEITSRLDHNKGIWIKPTNPSHRISVSIMKHGTTSTLSGTYLAMPPVSYQSLQQYEYYVTSYFWNNRLPTNYSSTVALVGCKPNTSVTITPSQRVQIPPHFILPSYPRGWLQAGESYSVLLQPMETLHLESIHDLTATRLVSDKPLTVLGSHECADVPVGVEFCDYLVEQFPPTVTWGRFFLFASANSRLTGELYKVIAMKSLTSVTVRCIVQGESSPELGQVVLLINATGESREFTLGANRLCSAVSDKPVLLVQYSMGYSMDSVGDPFMLMISPVEQYDQNFTITSPASYHNHLTVTVPLQHYDSTKILLNGTTLSGWSPVYCSDTDICGYATRLSVPVGTHVLRHTDADGRIMAYAYGFEYHDGYGQLGGMKLEWIADKCEHGALKLDTSQFLSLATFQEGQTATPTGEVQMCVEGVWTSMCGERLGNLETAVACTQLGFGEFGSAMNVSVSGRLKWPTVAGDVRCLGSEKTLLDCVRHWPWAGMPACSSGTPAVIRCYPCYNITVEIAASPSSQLHVTHSPVTLTCRAFPDTTLQPDQTLHLTWTRDGRILFNTTHLTISDATPINDTKGLLGSGVPHFESALTIRSMEPSDNGTYTCSAAVVSSSTGQPLSSPVHTPVTIGVVESESLQIQIRLLGIGNCMLWLFQYESPVEKLTSITATVSDHIRSRCQGCAGLVDARLITDAAFKCFSDTANEVTVRGWLHSPSPLQTGVSELVGRLEEWVSSGPSLSVSGVLLRVDRHCEVVIESFEDEECSVTSTTTTSTSVASSTPTNHWTTESDGTTTTEPSTERDPFTVTTTTDSLTAPRTTEGATVSQTTKGATAFQTTEGATAPQKTEGATAFQTTEGATAPQKTEGATAFQTTEGAMAPQKTEGAMAPQTSEGATAPQTTEGTTATAFHAKKRPTAFHMTEEVAPATSKERPAHTPDDDAQARDPTTESPGGEITRHTHRFSRPTPPTGNTQAASESVVIFVGIGSGVFVITLLVLSVACMVVVINCLRYRHPHPHPSSNGHAISATSPFSLPLYDDPVSDNLQMKTCTSPPKHLEAELEELDTGTAP